MDDEAIFYLQSRGIPRDEAERLIVSGFFQEVLDRVTIDRGARGRRGRHRRASSTGGRADGDSSGCARPSRMSPEGEARRFRRRAPDRGGRTSARRVPGHRRDLLHAQYYLDEGEVDVDDETIECPKHGSTFDLNSGKPRTLPATLPVEVFPVKTDGDDILIEV